MLSSKTGPQTERARKEGRSERDGGYCLVSGGLLLMEGQLLRLFVKGSRMGVERNEEGPSEGRKRDVVLHGNRE